MYNCGTQVGVYLYCHLERRCCGRLKYSYIVLNLTTYLDTLHDTMFKSAMHSSSS